MASSVFPAASLSFSAVVPFTFTAAAANTLYGGLFTAPAGTYTITCVNTTITKVDFYLGTTFVVTASTSSGTVTVNLATPADRVRLFTNTGTSVLVTITQTGNALISNISGILDTVTTLGSSTYTGTSVSGYGYALLVGAGGGGEGYFGNPAPGGGAGGACVKEVALTGSMALTIGAGGAGGTATGNPGSNGGASTFAGMTAGGGTGGQNHDAGDAGGVGSGGDVNTTGTAGIISGGVGASTANLPAGYPFIVTTLGTYGKAGYGGPSGGASGVAGTQGVLYVLRF